MLEPGDESRTTGRTVDGASTSSPSLRTRRLRLAGFAGLNALAAWAGAVALVTGGADLGERTNGRLPFDSLVIAGLALATIVAIPLTLLAWSAWTGAARTDGVALIVGLMLIGWIVVQVIVLRAFSLFQPAYLCVGASFVAASNRVRLGPHRRGILLVVVGAIVAAAGVGLVPHLIKNGLTIMSVVSVVAAARRDRDRRRGRSIDAAGSASAGQARGRRIGRDRGRRGGVDRRARPWPRPMSRPPG